MNSTKAILVFLFFQFLFVSQFVESGEYLESLETGPSDLLTPHSFRLEDGIKTQFESLQTESTSIEEPDLEGEQAEPQEKQHLPPEQLVYEPDALASIEETEQSSHIAAAVTEPTYIKAEEDPFWTDEDEEPSPIDEAAFRDFFSLNPETQEWLDSFCSALQEDKLDEFSEQNQDWHVGAAFFCFLEHGKESHILYFKAKLLEKGADSSIPDNLLELRKALQGCVFEDASMAKLYRLTLKLHISEHLLNKMQSAENYDEASAYLLDTLRKFKTFKSIMDLLKLSGAKLEKHGATAMIDTALLLDLVCINSAIYSLESPDLKVQSLSLARMTINTLGDSFLYAHKSVFTVLNEIDILRNSPMLKDLSMLEGSFEGETYLYLVLQIAKLSRTNQTAFMAERFRDICSIHLTSLLANQVDREDALKARKMLFESIPNDKTAVFYARSSTSVLNDAHAMLVRVEPREDEDTGRVYDIRLYNTGAGVKYHQAEAGYELGEEQRRAIYVDFKGVKDEGLRAVKWFTIHSTGTDHGPNFVTLYTSTGVEPELTEIPEDHYQRVQQSGTCVSSVFFAYLRSHSSSGRILEAKLKHSLIIELLERLKRLAQLLEERPELKERLAEIRKTKLSTLERALLESQLEKQFKETGLEYIVDDVALFILGEEFSNLIIDSLSAELEYMLYLNSKGLTDQAKVLLHIFKKFVRSHLPDKEDKLVGLLVDVSDMLYHGEKRTSEKRIGYKKEDLLLQLNRSFIDAIECELNLKSSKLNPVTFSFLMTIYIQALTSSTYAKEVAIDLWKNFEHSLIDEEYLRNYLSDLYFLSLKKKNDDFPSLFTNLKRKLNLKNLDSPNGKTKYKPKRLFDPLGNWKPVLMNVPKDSQDYIDKVSFLLLHPGHFLFCSAIDKAFFERILSEPQRYGNAYYENYTRALDNMHETCKVQNRLDWGLPVEDDVLDQMLMEEQAKVQE